MEYSESLIDLISDKLELNETQSGLLMYLSFKSEIIPENIRDEIKEKYPNCDFNKSPFPASDYGHEDISINKMIIVDFLEKNCSNRNEITTELNKIFYHCCFNYNSIHNSVFVNRHLIGIETNNKSSSLVHFKNKEQKVLIGLNYFSALIDMEQVSAEKVLLQLLKLDELSLKEKEYNEKYR